MVDQSKSYVNITYLIVDGMNALFRINFKLFMQNKGYYGNGRIETICKYQMQKYTHTQRINKQQTKKKKIKNGMSGKRARQDKYFIKSHDEILLVMIFGKSLPSLKFTY